MGNHVMAANSSISAETETPAPKAATRWWQWVLLYPTLAVTLISAVPTWLEKFQAVQLGVSRQNLALAQEQGKLWEANFECARAQDINAIRNSRNVEVGAQVCPSGDVLIRIKVPDAERPKLRWVSARSLEQAFLGLGPATAFAAPPSGGGSHGAQSVVNQRWLRTGLLKQRVRQGTGCVDLVIKTATGTVVSQTPVACGAAF